MKALWIAWRMYSAAFVLIRQNAWYHSPRMIQSKTNTQSSFESISLPSSANFLPSAKSDHCDIIIDLLYYPIICNSRDFKFNSGRWKSARILKSKAKRYSLQKKWKIRQDFWVSDGIPDCRQNLRFKLGRWKLRAFMMITQSMLCYMVRDMSVNELKYFLMWSFSFSVANQGADGFVMNASCLICRKTRASALFARIQKGKKELSFLPIDSFLVSTGSFLLCHMIILLLAVCMRRFLEWTWIRQDWACWLNQSIDTQISVDPSDVLWRIQLCSQEIISNWYTRRS